MNLFDLKKGCLQEPNEKFGQKRWCFEGETPKAKSEEPKKKFELPKIDEEVSEDESKKALEKVKDNREERKVTLEEARAKRAALLKSLGAPGAPAGEKDKGEKKEGEKKEEGPKIPERPKGAETGKQFMDRIKDLPQDQREDEIYKAISSGNVPSFLRKLQNVKTTFKGDDGVDHQVEYSITPQGLAIGCGGPEDGCDKPDFMRIPMTPRTAQRLAKDFDMMLPTSKLMAGAFESNQFAKVVMDALPAGATMSSNAFYQRHNELMNEALTSAGLDPTIPAIGGKKVITVEEGLDTNPSTLSFWGGLKPGGGFYQGGIEKQTIEKNNDKGETVKITVLKAKSDNAHEGQYVDYSHTAYLVSKRVKIDGEWMDQAEVNSRYTGLLSMELYPGATRTKTFDPFAYYGSEDGMLGHKMSTKEPGAEQLAYLESRKPMGATGPSAESSTTAVAFGRSTGEQTPLVPGGPKDRPKIDVATPTIASAGRPGLIHVGGGGGGGSPHFGGTGGSESAPIRVGGRGAPRISTTPVVEYSGVSYEGPRVKAKAAPSYKESPLSPERREAVPGKINGDTLFLGDSIMASTKGANIEVNGKRETFAKGGETSLWLLREITKLQNGEPTQIPANFKLDDFKNGNAVMMIGTNDIGSTGDGRFTKEAIWERIQQIWKILEDNGITVYACTIPPFKGHTFSTYRTKYDEVNAKRKWINEQIVNSGRKVIRTDELLADPADKDQLSSEYQRGSDYVHPNPGKLAKLLQSEVAKDQGNQPTEQPDAPGSAIARNPTEGIKIPERPKDAPTGSQFYEELKQIEATTPNMKERYEKEWTRIVEELSSGNIPPFEFQFKKITVNAAGASGQMHTIEYNVMPDYLSIGTNEDFIRVPMNGMVAKFIAERYDCIIPTQKMVDDIEGNANMVPFYACKNDAVNVGKFQEQEDQIQAYLKGKAPEGLIAGHKKDVVYSNYGATNLEQNPGWLAIYGARTASGERVQPNNTGGFHDLSHWDYSQGARLISKNMKIDGKPMRAENIFTDPEYAPLLNNEGVIDISGMYKPWKDLAPAWENIPGPKFASAGNGEQPAAQPQAFDRFPTELHLIHPSGGKDKENPPPAPAKAKIGTVGKEADDTGVETGAESVFDEFDYTHTEAGYVLSSGHAKFVRGPSGDEVVFTRNGDNFRIPINLDFGHYAPGKLPGNFQFLETRRPPEATSMSWILLLYFRKHGGQKGDVISFDCQGKQYLAQFQTHGPNAGHSVNHDGVGLAVEP